MILYLGTSALVKLYLEEPFSDIVRSWVKEYEIIATCRIAYTEIISALEKRFRMHDLSKSDYEMILKKFAQDWPDFAIIDFDEQEAAVFVKKYGLKHFDSIHLSAAKLIQRERKDISLAFSSADESLCRAAAAEGLKVLSFL